MNHYPESAGYKEADTSKEAAESTPAARLRGQVVQCLRTHGPLTPDECAALLGLSILSVRPRFSELNMKTVTVKTGEKRANASGKNAAVWRLATIDDVPPPPPIV